MKVKISVIVAGIIVALSITSFAVIGMSSDRLAVNTIPSPTISSLTSPTSVVTSAPIDTIGQISKEEAEDIIAKCRVREEESIIENLSKTYEKTEDEIKQLKNDMKNWKDVSLKLIEEKRKSKIKRLPREKVLELYEQGYSVEDIEKSELFAAECDKSPEEILKIKGKTTDFLKRNVDGEKIKSSTKTWEEVENVVGVNDSDWKENLNVSGEDVENMKQKGFSENEIAEIAVLADNYKKDYRTAFEQIEKGNSLEKLKENYTKESQNKKNTANRQITTNRQIDIEERENQYIEQLDITEEVADKCRKNNLRDIDMVRVSYFSDKYKVSADLVIEKYKKKGKWKKVVEELEANTND